MRMECHSNQITKVEKINNLPPIISIYAGQFFSLFLDETGSVWSCGNNSDGRLGVEGAGNKNLAEKIPNLPDIISVLAVGNGSSFFLDSKGSVWCCGSNNFGQLGLGDNTARSKTTKIEALPKIASIAGGYHHSLFLDEEGSVWRCGYNPPGGPLGLGDLTDRLTPVKIEGIPKIKLIAGGIHFSMFLDEEDNVWVCGSNSNGELGLAHNQSTNKPQKNGNLVGISAIAGGYNCSMFLDKQGNVFTCGKNNHGQLGQGDNNSRNTPQKVNNLPPIAFLSTCNSAEYFVQVVDFEGRVWGCGNNTNMQLGDSQQHRLQFQQVESIPKVRLISNKNPPNNEVMVKSNKKEKEIFKQLATGQTNNELRSKISANNYFNNLNKQQITEGIVEGMIPLADWEGHWTPIHNKNQELGNSILDMQSALNHKKQQQEKLQQEIEKMTKDLENMVEEKATLEFFDKFLQPIAETEKELRSGFEEKLQAAKYSEFSVDEVSLFLNFVELTSW